MVKTSSVRTNITTQGRLVSTFLTSSRSEAFWPGGGCTRSRVVAKVIRLSTMIAPPKIAMVRAQPRAESPPPSLATSGRGSAWMRNCPTSAPTNR